MGTARRLGLWESAIMLGAMLAVAVVVTISNTAVYANSSPDLEVALSVDDTTPYTGASFTLSATVTNSGDGESAATKLYYFRHWNQVGTTVGTDAVGALAPSGTSDESIERTAPSEARVYYYAACVKSVPGESDTSNDCSETVMVTIKERPDLRVTGTAYSIDLESPPGSGTFQMEGVLDNVGAGESESTTLRFYRSTDSTVTTSDTEVATAEVSSLDAGETNQSYWVTITAPSTEGTYYYGACVDEVAGESSTTNNCSLSPEAIPVPLPRPDLVAGMPSIDNQSPGPGATFLLTSRARNVGDWQSGPSTLRVYHSTDATITTSDTEVAAVGVEALDEDASDWETFTVTAPPIAGTHYYGACVDSVSGESDTTNNCSSMMTIAVPEGSPPTGLPYLTGFPKVNQWLTAHTDEIADEDGLTNVSWELSVAA